MQQLDIEIDASSDPVVIRPHGEVDAATAPALQGSVTKLLDQQTAAVVLDLSGVTFMDSSGLSSVVASYKHAATHGRSFRVAALPPAIARTFRITSLDRLIPIHLPAEQALAPAGHGPTEQG